MQNLNLADVFKQNFEQAKADHLELEEYLELCKVDPMAYASATERMVKAIGEPEVQDTKNDPRLSRIFLNRTIKTYPAFSDFYGMEATIEQVVSFYRHAAQGLEERKQILYLLGPVGGGKSSLAERLKELMEKFPIYVLTTQDGEMSPVFESPLGLFPAAKYSVFMRDNYGIDKRYLGSILSPWAVKRLKEFDGDLSKFKVTKVYPSKLDQIGISKTEPGDENNQDISCLVGKTDIRKLEHFSQNDTDAYSYGGGLNRAGQGLMEFVEMFKAPIKVLHPLITATQENNYVGTEAIGAIPFNGTVLAHSNESEWKKFRNNKDNEAFLDRICVIKVPYCLRVTEEQSIYKKMLDGSDLGKAPTAPETLKMLARFSILSRLKEHENSNLWTKMGVYDGENMRETDTRAKSVSEYRDFAGIDEGMEGVSTRFAFKVLSAAFNFDTDEIACDPVHLMAVLENSIVAAQYPEEVQKKYLDFIKSELTNDYAEFIGNEIQTAYLEQYSDYGQNLFDRYVDYADHWMQDIDYKDPDTNNLFNRAILDAELEKIEKPCGISNPKDFRQEVVHYVLRKRGEKGADGHVDWHSYEKLKKVIEKKMFSSIEELLPVISFGAKQDKETEKKHHEFLARMEAKGYTPRQTRRAVEWFLRMRKTG